MAREHNICGGWGGGGVNNVCLASELVSRLWEERAIVSNSTAPTCASVYGHGYKLEGYVNWSSLGSNGSVARLALGCCLVLFASPCWSCAALQEPSCVDACYLDCKASDTHFQRWQQGLD